MSKCECAVSHLVVFSVVSFSCEKEEAETPAMLGMGYVGIFDSHVKQLEHKRILKHPPVQTLKHSHKIFLTTPVLIDISDCKLAFHVLAKGQIILE